MSRKKKSYKKKPQNNNQLDEIRNIKNKIFEEEKELFNLKSEKSDITEKIANCILLNNNLKNLLLKYLSIDEEIKVKQNKQNNRKTDLQRKEEKLSDVDSTYKIEPYEFLKIGDAQFKVGLFNQECKKPVAICHKHEVYLSYKDIRNKKCFKHRNKKPCKHLEWVKDGIY